MRVNHDVLDRLQSLLADHPARAERRREENRSEARPSSEAEETIDRFSPSSDWDGLIDQVQGVAQHFRAIEKRIHAREIRVEQLLARAEEELNAAAERVRLAEARAEEAQAWADRQVAEAEQRAATAQERTRALEAVFARLRDMVLAEVPPEAEVVLFGRQRPPGPGIPPSALHKVA